MRQLAIFASMASLGLLVIACLLFFAGTISQQTLNWAALAITILWFAITPVWMGRDSSF